MARHEYERPWQVLPAKIIKLALEHAQREDDFDHQVAYLLLDIGVEAALKAYLINRGQNVEKIVFPELLKRVKDELPKTNPDLVGQIDDIAYFHGIRNKLYHQGDGVKPTEDNLERYSQLAKKVVEEVIEVKLETEEKRFLVVVERDHQEFEYLVGHIERHFKYFQESCAIVAEKARPAYGTREFAMKLKFILENWPDRVDDEPEDRLENRKQRLEKFNELVEKKQTNHAFVDYVLEDVSHLFVLITLQEISENSKDDWNEYVELDERRHRLLSDWKYGIQFERLTPEQVKEEFEKIMSWIKTQQGKVDDWIDSHLDNIDRGWGPAPNLDLEV